MKVTEARRIAFEVLRRVETEQAYAADLLNARLSEPGHKVRREDAALATELTLGVLRWQRLLDFLVERRITKSAVSLDPEVRLVLRLGFYQMRFLTRIPARAAVNESVELVKWARKRSAATLVNAVLRRDSAAAKEHVEKLLPPDLPPAEQLGILYSHPTWMVRRWLERFGEPRTVTLLEANNRAPRLVCAIHHAEGSKPVVRALARQGLKTEPGRWLRSALAVRGGSPTRTDAFRRGWISIQDEASQMIPLLLDVHAGQAVLDLCAAPGGKTSCLAQAAGPGALLVAADRHLHRLHAMQQQLRRLGLHRVRPVALDATLSLPFGVRFARILVDAPCSGTGTLARNPEIRWRLRPEDLRDFQRRQVTLLSHALEHLAPGGRLVYCTCSLEPEENEEVMTQLLRNGHKFRRVSAAPALAPHLVTGASAASFFGADGYFRTFPPVHHTDGFFAAVLE